MSNIRERIEAGVTICRWLSAGFDNNWSSNLQEPYVMLLVDDDVALELPDDAMAWASRFQASATSQPSFSLPAGILAKFYLGESIPLRPESD